MLFIARVIGLAPGVVSAIVAGIVITAILAVTGNLDAISEAVVRVFGSFNSVADAIGQRG